MVGIVVFGGVASIRKQLLETLSEVRPARFVASTEIQIKLPCVGMSASV